MEWGEVADRGSQRPPVDAGPMEVVPPPALTAQAADAEGTGPAHVAASSPRVAGWAYEC